MGPRCGVAHRSEASLLRCEELWRTSSVEAVQFEIATRKSTFRSGSGLPGRVWETGAPAYIPDVGHDVAFRSVDSTGTPGVTRGYCLSDPAGV